MVCEWEGKLHNKLCFYYTKMLENARTIDKKFQLNPLMKVSDQIIWK